MYSTFDKISNDEEPAPVLSGAVKSRIACVLGEGHAGETHGFRLGRALTIERLPRSGLGDHSLSVGAPEGCCAALPMISATSAELSKGMGKAVFLANPPQSHRSANRSTKPSDHGRALFPESPLDRQFEAARDKSARFLR